MREEAPSDSHGTGAGKLFWLRSDQSSGIMVESFVRNANAEATAWEKQEFFPPGCVLTLASCQEASGRRNW